MNTGCFIAGMIFEIVLGVSVLIGFLHEDKVCDIERRALKRAGSWFSKNYISAKRLFSPSKRPCNTENDSQTRFVEGEKYGQRRP